MQSDAPIPDPEVPAKATRRRFTAVEKVRILDEYASASAIDRAALCRRENIYSSLIANWRKQRDAGQPLAKRRGPKAKEPTTSLIELQKRNAMLEAKLAKAERVIDIQGKVYELLRACAGESADKLDLPPSNKSS